MKNFNLTCKIPAIHFEKNEIIFFSFKNIFKRIMRGRASTLQQATKILEFLFLVEVHTTNNISVRFLVAADIKSLCLKITEYMCRFTHDS